MAQPKTITLSPVAADPNGIATSQTPVAAGNLTLDGTLVSGGVATLLVPARVTVTSAGDDTGRTFTITGTDRYGATISEALTGANAGAATTTSNFATVTQIATDDATAGAVEAGNSVTLTSQWYPWNRYSDDRNIQLVQTGTATWYLEHTNSNVQAAGFVENDATVLDDTSYANKTASQWCPIETVYAATRLRVSAWTSGTLSMLILEDK